MTYRLGVDVGGTFTDVLLHDSERQRVWLAKTPSTPEDQSVGVIEGIQLAAARAEIELGQLDAILHGTTVATNAVLERRGALVGLIVTEGFRHILHLAEAWTPGPLVRLHGVREAGAADRYAVRARGTRADRSGRFDHRADRRGGRPQGDCHARRGRRRGAHGLPSERSCQRASRAHGGADRGRGRARVAGLDLVRDLAGVPRVRAHGDDARERVRRARAREVPGQCRGRAEGGKGPCADPGRPFGRRPDEPRGRLSEPRPDGALGSRRRRERRVGGRDASRVRAHPHLRHGRHLDRCRGLRLRPARDHARDERRRLPGARAGRRRREHRRRRRLDRLHRRGDRRTPCRPTERGGRSRAGLLRPRRHRCDRHGRQRRPRSPPAATARRSHEARRGGGPPGGARVADARGAGVEETARAIVDMVDESDAGRAAGGDGPAGPDTQRLRPRRLRRRRRRARERAGEDSRRVPCDRSGRIGRPLGDGLHLVRHQERVQPDVRSEHRVHDDRRRARALRVARLPRPGLARRRGRGGRRPGPAFHPRHAVCTPGIRDPDRARRGRAGCARPRRAGAHVRRCAPTALRLRAGRRRRDRESPRRGRRPCSHARGRGACGRRRGRLGRPDGHTARLDGRRRRRRPDLRPSRASAGHADRRLRDRRAVRRDDRRAAGSPRRRRSLDEPPHLAGGASR